MEDLISIRHDFREQAEETGPTDSRGHANRIWAREVTKVLDRFIVPRPASEYHEGMGTVLWWRMEEPTEFEQLSAAVVRSAQPARWAGEAPYIGTPLDLGHTVEIHVRMHGEEDVIHRHLVGGWTEGYYTHFTPIIIPEIPQMGEKKRAERDAVIDRLVADGERPVMSQADLDAEASRTVDPTKPNPWGGARDGLS